MCEFCDKEEYFDTFREVFDFYIKGNRLMMKYANDIYHKDTTVSVYTYDECEINYCPMCGRKL